MSETWKADYIKALDEVLESLDALAADLSASAPAREFKARNRIHGDLTEWSYNTFMDAANDIGDFLYPEDWEVVSRHVGPWRESGTK